MYNMYVELDSFIDTRFTLLYMLSPSLATSVASDGTYASRRSDKFKYLTHKVFDSFYARRDRRVLLNPRPTLMRDTIIDYIIKQKAEVLRHNLKTGTVMYLNTYPYKLTDYETAHMINGISGMIPKDVTLEVINEKLTSAFIIEKGIITIFKYDGLAWIEEESREGRLKPFDLEHKVLFVPDVYNAIDGKVDTFNSITEIFIRVELTDPAIWSSVDLVIIQRQKEMKENPPEEEPEEEEELPEEITVDLSLINKMIDDTTKQ